MTIRILVADDDAFIVRCYQKAFAHSSTSDGDAVLESLNDELFGSDNEGPPQPTFELVACSQGDDAVAEVGAAIENRRPFDAVVLDVRMPPGISGVDAGCRIRRLDADVPILFVSGYSDISFDELKGRIPPESKLHWFSKPLSFCDLAEEVTQIVQSARAEAS